MIDYLNQHHVYIDAHNAPDMSAEVKRDECDLSAEFRRDWMAMMQEGGANIMPKTVETLQKSVRTDAERGAELMENRIDKLYGTPSETPAERIIRLYRSGMSHVDISGRGFDLAEVRRVISEATRADEKLYQVHKEGRV